MNSGEKSGELRASEKNALALNAEQKRIRGEISALMMRLDRLEKEAALLRTDNHQLTKRLAVLGAGRGPTVKG
jgi:hypothetical protein